jgi:hypothetical protein
MSASFVSSISTAAGTLVCDKSNLEMSSSNKNRGKEQPTKSEP